MRRLAPGLLDAVLAETDIELLACQTERFRRKDFGHMDVEITIDDPKAYTKSWTVTLPLILRPDTELLEYICNENNKYFELLPK